MGMFVRALAYMMSHGADGLRMVAEDAILNANYVMARLKDSYNVPFPGPCMHECLFDDHSLKDTGVTTLDIAKGMIDEGFHPMTMYFPLVVHGAMLIEPTETESKASVDQFCDTMLHLMERARRCRLVPRSPPPGPLAPPGRNRRRPAPGPDLEARGREGRGGLAS